MKFSYNWLQSYFSKPLGKPQELAELLTMHSFEVESLKEIRNDWILDIDILPNRAHDCLSYSGLAREVAALTNYKLSATNYKQTQNFKTLNKKFLNVQIQDKSLVTRYTAYVIEGVNIKQSPKWMRDRLASVEQKAINNVVDLTNFIMWDSGQPLHAFDFEKIKGGQMTIRESKKGEKLETLDGETRLLGNSDIIIEDAGRIIDLAGVKGGVNTQIDKDTSTIILQAAIFDPTHIRSTTQSLGFRTDAAVRYMHGFDSNLPPNVLDYSFSLILETNPDARLVEVIDIYPNPTKPKKIILDVSYANSLLGTNLSKEKIKQNLERLNFKLPSFAKAMADRQASSPDALGSGPRSQHRGHKLQAIVPTYRLDIENQEDLIEEVGRIYGYENIRAEHPSGLLESPRRNEQVFWRSAARGILSGFGFSEVYNYSLIARPPVNDKDFLELENPVSEEFKYMRPLLMFGALKNIARNARYEDSLKIFEFGKVFYKEKNKIKETEDLIIALNDTDGFYLTKGYVDELLKSLGLTSFYYSPMPDDDPHSAFLHAGRRVNILIDNKPAGFLGEVDPGLASSYDVKGRVVVAELDFDKIAEEAEEEKIYHKPSKYPEVVRDISLIVPSDVVVLDVLNTINAVSGPLLRDTDLFDMFEGLSDDMKSFAFHLLFQSEKKTLTSTEIDEIMGRIIKTLNDKGWEVR